MAVLEFNTLLRVGMSTYYGNLDRSEGVIDWMSQDLKGISHDGGHVTMQMLDGSVRNDVVINDIDSDFDIDWDKFSGFIAENCEKDIDGSVMMASNHKYQNLSDLLDDYGMTYEGFGWFMPKYYNYDNDSLDLKYDLEDLDWSLEKYGLTELVQKYIDEVRVKSYDGYCSFEPSKIEDVCWNDYCVMWAILQKEGVFDTIRDELQEYINTEGYMIYDDSITGYYYIYIERNIDESKRHYFRLDYDGEKLIEINRDETSPNSND